MDNMNKRQQEIVAKKTSKELGNLTKIQYVCCTFLPKNIVPAERLQNVVKWLEPLNSEAKLRERRQPQTCEWLPSQDQFVSWYSSGSFL